MKTYAGFWLRVKAFVWDYFVILGYLILLAVFGLILDQISGTAQWMFANRVRAQVSGFLLGTLPVMLYFAAGEASPGQATWGKRKMKLKVMDQNGERVHFPRAFARTLLKFIPWELSHALIWQLRFLPDTSSAVINYGFALVYILVGLNLACSSMTSSRQTVYDLLAGTYVMAGHE